MGIALAPLLRAALGIDAQIQMNYFTVITLLIGGLMCGLTGMILLSRKLPALGHKASSVDASERRSAALLHLSGLLIFTCVPLLNFFACYWYWINTRATSSFLDYHGREAINMQIAIYLYLLVSLFLAYIFVGVFLVLAILLFAFAVSLYAASQAIQGKWYRYPANIATISRDPASA